MAENTPPPELRRDPITGDWVILAAGRGRRPHAPGPAEAPDQPDQECPFCPGHEERTPPELAAYRKEGKPDTPGWTVRAFPNRFPILAESGSAGGAGLAASPDHKPAVGAHEVIIDTPHHDKTPWEAGADQVRAMLEMYRDRILALKRRGVINYVHIIRNHGAAGAASLEHPHSQLFGLPFVPPQVSAEMDGFVLAQRGEARCVLCDMLAREEIEKTRLVAAGDNFLAFCPFASRLPYETWIVPRRHETAFEECDELEELASLITDTLNRFRDNIGDPPFNYWIHTYPLHGESRPYHWHLEILPRLTIPGGLEMGAGMWVNTVEPERAAAALKEQQGRRPD
ncbi:MAG: galactose-1-phosphate uridylyltransferase [Actinomycetota bacterium]